MNKWRPNLILYYVALCKCIPAYVTFSQIQIYVSIIDFMYQSEVLHSSQLQALKNWHGTVFNT